MKLRCKPGDMAIVIGGKPEYLGLVVTVTVLTYRYGLPHWDTAEDHPVVFADLTLQPLPGPGQLEAAPATVDQPQPVEA